MSGDGPDGGTRSDESAPRRVGDVRQEREGTDTNRTDPEGHHLTDPDAGTNRATTDADRDTVQGPAGQEQAGWNVPSRVLRSEEHTSELQSRQYLVCRLLLEKKKSNINLINLFSLSLPATSSLPKPLFHSSYRPLTLLLPYSVLVLSIPTLHALVRTIPPYSS